MKKVIKRKRKQIDFTHRYCCYGVAAANEDKQKRNFFSIILATSKSR